MPEPSILSVLRERAGLQPDDTAFTFTDYEQDWAGATVQEITGGRVAAISVPVDHSEKLVTIIELKKRGESDVEVMHRCRDVKNNVTSAISKSHGLNVADLVLVPPGSIPTTTSGKITRAACVERYRHAHFTRLDA